jgi:hypothetical protein
MTIPEALWELSLGIYLVAKGFRRDAPILATDATVRVLEYRQALMVKNDQNSVREAAVRRNSAAL